MRISDWSSDVCSSDLEFGITQAGQSLAGLLVFISDVHALGLKTAQGLVVTTAFYWDQNDEMRAWSKRFAEKMDGRMPTMIHAGVYSEGAHYLKAIKEVGNDDAKKVADQTRAMQIGRTTWRERVCQYVKIPGDR